ncbi:sigma-54-dependent Fis family transcriptional regulator [Methylococcus sp. EFPC2]|uniref:sigma-54 interaction domain-containing protein n=1 Tax=Methylococcus sp. EFPC2 TaxID=2812648 RepID=UPI0019684AE3|nr:sigma-54-dependent Fis family transcriptional regulator [Methylococcus sp. EFPC2]QSA99047.1 sigma 54-interacting transcriptional regulator [Methylococcus sp. EFPC2]
MIHSISLRSLLETHDQPFVIIDSSLTIQGVNRAYERHFTVDKNELIGRPCCCVTGEQSSAPDCRHRHLFRDYEPYHLTHTVSLDGGEQRSYQVRGYPLVDADKVIYLGESIVPLDGAGSAASGGLAGASQAHKDLLHHLDLAARSPVPVLLLGETGSGKEVAVEYLHTHSARCDKSLIVVDCTVLGEDLFESEVFGHEKGAFTGAGGQKKGLFELADQGTLFLDEVGDLPLSQQPKLLRALETGTFRRVGGSELRRADVRVVAATHRSLPELVRQGRFREDLYYRLAVYTVHVPPLRERKEDIAPIADLLLRQIGLCLDRTVALAPEALARLQAHDYPGNVRELRNILQLAATVTSGPLIEERSIVLPELPPRRAHVSPEGGSGQDPASGEISPLEAMELAYIQDLLQKHDGSRRRVAAEMNISERTLYRKLKRYRLND